MGPACNLGEVDRPLSPARRLLLTASACVATGGGASACAPRAANVEGAAVNNLYGIFLVVAAVVFVVVAGLITWSIIRYRAAPGDDALPKQFDRNLKLEVTWFAIPQLIVIGLFIASTTVLGEVNAEAPEPDVTVSVQGYTWGWRFSYEEDDVHVAGGPEEPVRITLPVDQDITFELTSADVIHSFYVPRFLIKRDMVPGQTNRLDVRITEEGLYRGACTEFCGLLHDRMRFEIQAVEAAEYEQWIEGQRRVAGGNS